MLLFVLEIFNSNFLVFPGWESYDQFHSLFSNTYTYYFIIILS